MKFNCALLSITWRCPSLHYYNVVERQNDSSGINIHIFPFDIPSNQELLVTPLQMIAWELKMYLEGM